MKKLAVVVTFALCSLAMSQNWEYAIYQANQDDGVTTHSFYERTGETSGHRTAEELFKGVGRAVSARNYGTTDELAILNYLGYRGWEVWSVTRTSESGADVVRYYLKRPR